VEPQQTILLAVALVVGLLAICKREPTAGALVAAYVVSLIGLPSAYFIFPDIFTLAVIFCKPDYRPCPAYLGDWHQLKCLFLERSPTDRFIMLSFPVAWCFYSPSLSVTQYWVLWGIALAQFIAASLEPLSDMIRSRAEASRAESRSGLEFAVG
jgi:hypothetical protein